MKLTNSQENVIHELFKKTVNSLLNNENSSVFFKAPTGSGKTFMMLNYINQLIEWSKQEFNQKLVFVIVTLSSAELPKQMHESFKIYRQHLINKNIEIQRIESPSNINKNSKVEKNYQFFAKENNVYIMGGASFRKKSILYEQGSIDAFLAEIRLTGYKLIYIRDEAHIGSKITLNKDEKHFEKSIQEAAHFVVKMTATPDTSAECIELSEKDLETDEIKLLKSYKKYNAGLEHLTTIDNETILQKACEVFLEIKKLYNDNELEPGLYGINPAMLIQVENDSFTNKEQNEKFQKNLASIIKILEKNNLTWVKYFDQNKKESNLRHKENYSLRDISKDSSPIDVVIFKIGPATGWNIPRACMLVQLRDVSSNNLSVQTIGRIKRNPNPNYEFKDISVAKNYYLYSNIDIKDTEIKSFKLKNKYQDQKFIIGNIETKYKEKIIDENVFSKYWIEKFKNKAYFNTEVFENMENLNIGKENDNKFIIAKSKNYGGIEFINTKIYNLIELETFNFKLFDKYKRFLTSEILKYLENFYQNNLKNKITDTLFWYIFFINYVDEIKEYYLKQLQKELNNNSINFKFENKELPLQISTVKKEIVNINEDNFAYEEMKKDELLTFFLDSQPEKDFVLKLQNFFEFSDKKIEIWAKNPANIGINIQYLTIHEPQIYNSYPDFILKNNDHYIYLEIKQYHSNNELDKIKNLYNGYKKYIEQNRNSKIKLTLCICFVENKDHNIKLYFAGASTIRELNEMLNIRQTNDIKHLHDEIRSSDKSLNLTKILSQ
ncbi:type III restriction enzyme [Mycoplasmopsis mustelae]|uniref:Type III restriction enzyme n=1 Tax=Mycoplasmopsis mustelae TaxID=171289 RepID=A0A4R7UDJ1_9BACT|nr:DEAD/DEAH box helicase family protein [Mycoplasmopsis mustelae]TDV24116.1 type III restriction enzyme [Mycoplasmopsis mustelae]